MGRLECPHDVGHVSHDVSHVPHDIGHVPHDVGHVPHDVGHVSHDVGGSGSVSVDVKNSVPQFANAGQGFGTCAVDGGGGTEVTLDLG